MMRPPKLTLCICMLIMLLLSFYGCSKDSSSERIHTFSLAGIENLNGNYNLFSFKLDSGIIHATTIGCFNQYSTVFDPYRKYFGYIDCDTVFRLMNPVTGDLIKSFKVPGMLVAMAVDSADNAVIGKYYTISYGADTTVTDRITKISLESGEVLADNPVDLGFIMATYWLDYYYQNEKLLLIQTGDYLLHTINPVTGSVTNTSSYGYPIICSAFRRDSIDVVALTYSYADSKNYLDVIEPIHGLQKRHIVINEQDEYLPGIAIYDKESNSLVLANSKKEIVFINIITGLTSKTSTIGKSLTEIKFWK